MSRMRVRGAAALLIGAVLAVGGCTSDEKPDPDRSTGATETSEASGPEWSTSELSAAVFEEEDVLTTVDGEIVDQEQPASARVEVLELSATDLGTFVRFRYTYTGEGKLLTGTEYLSPDRIGWTYDVRDIALRLPEDNLRLRPTIAVPDANPDDRYGTRCLCSTLTGQALGGTPMTWTATFPPLDADVETVDLEIVGFPIVEKLAVDRGTR